MNAETIRLKNEPLISEMASRKLSWRKDRTSRLFSKDSKSMRSSAIADDGLTLFEGYLEKLGSGTLRSWASRYFVIQSHYLKYYEVNGHVIIQCHS
jgi:hypothetical protein